MRKRIMFTCLLTLLVSIFLTAFSLAVDSQAEGATSQATLPITLTKSGIPDSITPSLPPTLTPYDAASGWLRTSPNVYLYSGSDKVGIGTTTPDRKLTVYSAGSAYTNVKDGTHEILTGVDSNGGIVSVMTNHDLILRAGGNSEKMRLKIDGKVGIGTASPNAKLTVNGNSRINGTGTITSTDTTKATGTGTLFTTELKVGDIIFAGGQAMTVKGISSDTELYTTEAFMPHIYNQSYQYQSPVAVFNRYVPWLISVDPSSGDAALNTASASNTAAPEASPDADDIIVKPPVMPPFYFQSFFPSLVVNSLGNVGIKTAAPEATLDIRGSLRVNEGTIFSKIQAGKSYVGSSTSRLKVVTIYFDKAFENPPSITVTPRGENYGDVFAVTTRNITTTSFQVNVLRVDSSSGWGQSLYVDWMAWTQYYPITDATIIY
jgi:hypothetical protein